MCYLAAVAATGCTGVFAGESATGERLDDPAPSPVDMRPPPDPACGSIEVEAAPLARLTASEYQRTVTDLIGHDPQLSFDLTADSDTHGFRVGTQVPTLLVEQYVDAADEIAERAVADHLSELVPCASDADRACAEEFIRMFGGRAFRRPITDAEQDEYFALYDIGAEESFARGIEAAMFGFLASPKFLYFVEAPGEAAAPGTTAPLDQYGIASRMSYFLWGTMPDDLLLDAAAAGQLIDDGLEAQARRMLDDPRATLGIREFGHQWLGLDGLATMQRDEELYPEFDAELPERLRRSVLAFFEEAYRGDRHDLNALLLGDAVYADPELAALFGLNHPGGNELIRFTAPLEERAGLLSQPGLMARYGLPDGSDPIHRGIFVRERVLCGDLPSPPDNLNIDIPEPVAGETTRQRFSRHSSDPNCTGCHSLIDPIGFGFEHYDALGRWRAEEDGRVIDATGEVLNAGDAEGSFNGIPDLAARFAASDHVASCVATQSYRYAMGRSLTNFDDCSIAQIRQEFVTSGYDLKELLVSIVRSDAFLNIHIPEGVAP
ncbi:MAG: DUF1592 domain-containing protein [Myxococcota bacterium]